MEALRKLQMFKVPKENKIQPTIPYPVKIALENGGQAYILRKLNFERICHQKTCTKRNIEESSSDTREWDQIGIALGLVNYIGAYKHRNTGIHTHTHTRENGK